MPKTPTLGEVIDQHFRGTLAVFSIGKLPIKITNDPSFEKRTFTVEAVGATGPDGFQLFDSDDLVLDGLTLSLTYNGPKEAATGTITGKMAVASVPLSVTITLSKEAESFSVESKGFKPLSIAKFASTIAGKKLESPPGLDGVKISDLSVSITVAKKMRTVQVDGTLSDRWDLPFGDKVTTALVATWKGKASVALSELRLTGQIGLPRDRQIDLAYDLSDKDRLLTGSFDAKKSPFLPADALALFGVDMGRGFPNSFAKPKGLDLARFAFKLDFEQDAVTLEGANSLGDTATVYAFKADDGGWQFAFLISTGKGWKAKDLSKELKPVDDFLALDQAFIGVATDSISVDGDIHPELGSHHFSMHTGLNLGAAITLDARQGSMLAKSVYGLCGRLDFMLAGSIGPQPSDVALTAVLDDMRLSLPNPGKGRTQLVMSDCQLTFSLPLSVSLGGTVVFPATKKGETVDVTGDVTFQVDPPSISFKGDAKIGSLPPPKGADGLELEEIDGSFTIDVEGVVIGLGGTVLIEKTKGEFHLAFALPELEPTFLYADIHQLDLAPLFEALCTEAKGRLPKPISKGIQFKELKLWDCNDVQCNLSPNRSVKTGFGFLSDAVVFGFPCDAEIEISTEKLVGKLCMGKAISIPGFAVSDARDHTKGPQFDFDTSQKEILVADYRMVVFGFENQATLDFGPEGFSFSGGLRFASESLKATCSLGIAGGRFTGRIVCVGKFGKRPIVFKLSRSLSVKISSVRVLLSTSGRFSYTVKARVINPLKDYNKTITGTITLGRIGHQLHNLGREIEKDAKNIKKWL